MKSAIESAFNNILSSLSYPKINVLIQLPKNSEHGDFATNVALQLGNKMNSSPKDIAKTLIDHLVLDYSNLIASAEIAGPGFINIRINKDAISQQLYEVLKSDKNYGKNSNGNGNKAQVEFVSANPTGPLTVAHGRGAILGDVISLSLIHI